MADSSKLYKAGFDTTEEPVKPCLVVSLMGFPKSGRTDFACKAPGPILYQALDMGEDGVVQKHQRLGKQIARKRYEYEGVVGAKGVEKGKLKSLSNEEYDQISKTMMANVWKPFVQDINNAIESGLIRTIVWDKATEVYEVQRLAYYGKMTSIGGEEGRKQAFGFMFAEYKKLVRNIKLAGLNLIMIHDLKEQWKTAIGNDGVAKSVTTGKWELKGSSAAEALVDTYVEQRYIPPSKVGQETPGRFEMEIIKNRMSPDPNGLVLENDSISFENLAALVAPDVDPEKWADS